MIDPKKVKQVKTIKHNSPFLGGRFDPSGRYFFAGAQDNSVQRWEWETGKKTAYLGHNSWIRAIAFDPAQKALLSGDYAGKLLAWSIDSEKPEVLKSVDAHRGFLRALAVSPNGKWLASCGNDQKVRLWSLPDLKPGQELNSHQSHVYNVAFHPNGKHLVSADLKGVIKQWDLTTGQQVREMDGSILQKYDKTFRAVIGGVRGMCFSKEGAYLACAGITNVSNAFAGVGNPVVVLFDWKTGKRKQLFRPKAAFKGSGWGIVHHTEDLFLGVGAGGSGGALWYWKVGQEKSIHKLKLPTNARDLDLHPNGNHVAIPFADGSMRVYSLSGA